MNTLDLDQQLNTMIVQGKSVDALKKFYAEDVVSRENDEPERIGRESWIRGRQEMEKNTRKFEARVLAHAANGDTSFSEWEYDIVLEGMGALKIAQVGLSLMTSSPTVHPDTTIG